MMEVDAQNYIPPPIEQSFDQEDYSSVVKRYYTQRYIRNVRHKGDDYCILIHSNRVCLVTLAPSHELLKNDSQVEHVEFQVNEKRNTFENKTSGKRKHGALILQPNTVLFTAQTTDGTAYRLCSGIKGKLLEVNYNLKTTPNLMKIEPLEKGFLAIVLPYPNIVDSYKENLMTEEQYTASLVDVSTIEESVILENGAKTRRVMGGDESDCT